MHLEWNATCGFAFGDRCFGPFCDSLPSVLKTQRYQTQCSEPYFRLDSPTPSVRTFAHVGTAFALKVFFGSFDQS